MIRKLLLPITGISLIAVGVLFWNMKQQENKIYYLTLATGTQSGNYYPVGKAIAEVIELHNPKIKVKVIETEGSDQNMTLLAAKQADLAMVQNDAPTPANARAVVSLFREVFHLIVSNKSNIKTVTDLKGKRIALMSKGSGSYKSFWLLSDHYGLDEYQFKHTAVSWTEATKLLKAGHVDAIFRVLPIGNIAIRELLQSVDGTLVNIDQGAAMKIQFPYLESDIIPKGAYKASPPVPSQNADTVGVQATLLAHEEVNPEVIKEVTQILFEYRRDLVQRNPLTSSIDMPGKDGGLTAPMHEGAQAYYEREKPDFFAENADVLGLWLSIGTLVASAIFSWRSKLSSKKKIQADKYNLEIINLIEKVSDSMDMQEVKQIRDRLLAIFRGIVEDLDKDQVSSESFESFTFTWETAMASVRDRERFLLRKDLSPLPSGIAGRP